MKYDALCEKMLLTVFQDTVLVEMVRRLGKRRRTELRKTGAKTRNIKINVTTRCTSSYVTTTTSIGPGPSDFLRR